MGIEIKNKGKQVENCKSEVEIPKKGEHKRKIKN